MTTSPMYLVLADNEPVKETSKQSTALQHAARHKKAGASVTIFRCMDGNLQEVRR